MPRQKKKLVSARAAALKGQLITKVKAGFLRANATANKYPPQSIEEKKEREKCMEFVVGSVVVGIFCRTNLISWNRSHGWKRRSVGVDSR